MERTEARRVGLALIAAHNIIQNTVLNRQGYVTGNLVVSGAVIGIARASGATPSEMGLSPRLERSDLRTVALASALIAGGSIGALAHPISREVLRDERARDRSTRVIAYKSLVRFPIGTAMFEEVAFRGVLPTLIGRSHTAGDLVAAGVFGLWHVIPTARALAGNPLSKDITLVGRTKTVLAGCAATTLAALGFSWLRRRGGSILVPWLVHSGFNTITYLAGVIAWRLSDREA